MPYSLQPTHQGGRMAQTVRQDIHTIEDLLGQSRSADNVRHSHRILAIRDILCGDMRQNICVRYGVSRESLRHWVSWYNESGVVGLKEGARPGRPKQIAGDKIAAFKERIEKQPCPQKDGVVRWRSIDIQKVLEEEFGATYTSLFGVRKLCHSLGLSFMTTRPRHPKQDDEAVAAFKKTPHATRGNPTKTPRQKNRIMVSG